MKIADSEKLTKKIREGLWFIVLPKTATTFTVHVFHAIQWRNMDTKKVNEEKFEWMAGSIIEATEELEFSNGDKTVTIHEGDKAIVGFDGYLYPLKTAVRLEIGADDVILRGFSATGLADFLVGWLDGTLDLEFNLQDNIVTVDDLRDSIEKALMAIGMSQEVAVDAEEETE